MAEQLQFPFPSLDFPGRTLLYPHEIAGPKGRLGMSLDHFYDLIAEGVITGVDISSPGAKRRELRVPIESYRDFIVARITGPMRSDLLRNMPKATLRDLRREIDALLSAAA